MHVGARLYPTIHDRTHTCDDAAIRKSLRCAEVPDVVSTRVRLRGVVWSRERDAFRPASGACRSASMSSDTKWIVGTRIGIVVAILTTGNEVEARAPDSAVPARDGYSQGRAQRRRRP